MSVLTGISVPLTAKTKRKEYGTSVFACNTCSGEVALLSCRTDTEITLWGSDPKVLRLPGRGLSTSGFHVSLSFCCSCFFQPVQQVHQEVLYGVHACFYQTALSSVLRASLYKPVAVIRWFDTSFLHAQLIESWKLSFTLVWPCYLCLPVISHLGVIFYIWKCFKILNKWQSSQEARCFFLFSYKHLFTW